MYNYCMCVRARMRECLHVCLSVHAYARTPVKTYGCTYWLLVFVLSRFVCVCVCVCVVCVHVRACKHNIFTFSCAFTSKLTS